MSTIGVIVITYNGEKYIIQQLDSIRKQTVKPNQVIIYDDCSTDSTPIIVSEYIDAYHLDNWYLYCNKNNIGWTKNCQNAFRECKTDIIFWSDQDDIWLPDKISVMLSIMQSEDYLILYSNWTYIDSDGKQIFKFPKENSNRQIRVKYNNKNIPPMLGCSACIKKQIIELFEKILPCEFDSPDWILYYIGISLNKIGYINKVLFKRRIHDSNVTSSITRIKRTWNFSYRKHTNMIQTLLIQYKTLNKIIKMFENSNHLCDLTYIKAERDYLKNRLSLLLLHKINLRYFIFSIKQNSLKDCINTIYKDLLYLSFSKFLY